MVELKHLRVKLRDIEGSDKLITGLATPLCLFGSLMVILVACVCMFQNTEGIQTSKLQLTLVHVKHLEGVQYICIGSCFGVGIGSDCVIIQCWGSVAWKMLEHMLTYIRPATTTRIKKRLMKMPNCYVDVKITN